MTGMESVGSIELVGFVEFIESLGVVESVEFVGSVGVSPVWQLQEDR